jgi:hypothetical protein
MQLFPCHGSRFLDHAYKIFRRTITGTTWSNPIFFFLLEGSDRIPLLVDIKKRICRV